MKKEKTKYEYNTLKKVFVPSTGELYEMQDMGANIYKYLVVKAAEVIIADGVNFTRKEMLDGVYNTLKDNPDLAHAIGLLYPEEIKNLEIAQYDYRLCYELLNRNNSKDNNIYNLDCLSYFEENIGINLGVFSDVLETLTCELPNVPRYRFEYKPSKLLDDIFARKVDLNRYLIDTENKANKLMKIEPAYGLLDDYYKYLGSSISDYNQFKNEAFCKNVDDYAKRYKISEFAGEEYKGKDILTNPDPEVKRLIKCINDRKHVVYNR